jgi:hypothetical protein
LTPGGSGNHPEAPGCRHSGSSLRCDSSTACQLDVREAHRQALRDTREFFQAAHGCIAALGAGRSEVDLPFMLPKQAGWYLGVLTRYIRHTHPPLEPGILIGSVRRRGGAWGAIALAGSDHEYDREDRRLMARIAGVLSAAVHRIDRDWLLGVRD